MRKNITYFLVFLFFLGTLFAIFPPAELYTELKQGNVTKSQIVFLICLGLSVKAVTRILEAIYPHEYKAAHSISHTPRTKYGWYGLIFFVALMFCYFGYLFILYLLG